MKENEDFEKIKRKVVEWEKKVVDEAGIPSEILSPKQQSAQQSNEYMIDRHSRGSDRSRFLSMMDENVRSS